MSNCLYIEVVESRIAGTDDPFEYSIVAYDSYATLKTTPYDSIEELFSVYPTRLSILDWLQCTSEFEDSIELDNSKVTMLSVSSIAFAGYPEDDSISNIERI